MEKVYIPRKLAFVSPIVVLKEFLDAGLKAESDLYQFFHGKERIEHFNEQIERNEPMEEQAGPSENQIGPSGDQVGPIEEIIVPIKQQARISAERIEPEIEKIERARTEPIGEDTRKNFATFIERRGHFAEAAQHAIAEVDQSLEQMISQFPIIDYEPAYPPLNSKLLTHKVIDDVRKASESAKAKMMHLARSRYYHYKEFALDRPLHPKRQIAEKDFIMTAHLMRPSNYLREDAATTDFRSMCEMKFLVRGEMPLMRLREKILCQADFWCNLEDTEDASSQSNYFMHQFPSGFMFIHDTFYVDDSHPDCKDISKPIQEFMTRKKQCFNEYHVKKMSEARMSDFKLRIGFPYIFVHQGHCEHLMIFTDLRIMHANDVPDLEEYPLTVYDAVHSMNCCACKEAAATYVVTESDRLPTCPAFMCESCFKSFNYDRNTRIGNFKAYHYIDRGNLE